MAASRLKEFAEQVGYLPLAPDLVAEVVSPGDSSSDVEAKLQGWLDAGVSVVLAVDPQNSTIREYRPDRPIRPFSSGFVGFDDVLTGFELDVAELFG